MKKFVFSLEKVLDLKNQMLDVLLSELMQLQAREKQIEEEIVRLNGLFQESNKEMRSALKTGITPQKVMSYKMYLHAIDRDIDECIRQKEECVRRMGQKKAEIIQLKSELSGLEKLKEKQEAVYKENVRKMEERNIEEFVSQTCLMKV